MTTSVSLYQNGTSILDINAATLGFYRPDAIPATGARP